MESKTEVSTPVTAASGEIGSGQRGLTFRRLFTQAPAHPFDEVEWVRRTASIQNEKGKTIFEQQEVEVPKAWSQTAANIVASKYFHGKLGTPERESSVKPLIRRVADTVADWGREDGYFLTEEDRENFRCELTHLLVHQMAAFNSPVWFNDKLLLSRSIRSAI